MGACLGIAQDTGSKPPTLVVALCWLDCVPCPKNGTVLLTLSKPHGPLSSNTVGSITKRLLHTFGISTAHWGPTLLEGRGSLFTVSWGCRLMKFVRLGNGKALRLLANIIRGSGQPSRRALALSDLCTTSHLVIVRSPTSLGLR